MPSSASDVGETAGHSSDDVSTFHRSAVGGGLAAACKLCGPAISAYVPAAAAPASHGAAAHAALLAEFRKRIPQMLRATAQRRRLPDGAIRVIRSLVLAEAGADADRARHVA